MAGPPLILSPGWRTTCTILQLVPVPGVGAAIAGWRNPHTRLLGRGIGQAVLVVFGSWPLIIPGAVGFLWAVWDATRIAKAVPPPAWSEPTPDADPETVRPSRQKKAERRRAEGGVRGAPGRANGPASRKAQRARRKAERAEQAARDDTRWMP